MKIAIVLNSSWNIYNFRMSLIDFLLASGHEVHTIAPVDNYTSRLTERGCVHHKVIMDSCGINPVKDLCLTFGLWRIYRKIQPDVLFHYTIKPNIYGSLAAALLKIPAINNVCGLGTVFLHKNLLTRISGLLYRFSFKFCQKVFFHNDDDLNYFKRNKLVRSHVADKIPGSGIDLVKFQPKEYKKNRVFTFLLIARLIVDKGVLEYIEAIKLMRLRGLYFRCQILGAQEVKGNRGIKADQIDEWVATGIIEYLGVTEDVRPYVQSADCIVLPSYREGASRALLEAASLSKPIVATDVPGCNTIVKHEWNGLLCKVKNPGDLAEKMITMSELSSHALKQLGENGRKMVEEKFSDQLVIKKYCDAICELTKVLPNSNEQKTRKNFLPVLLGAPNT